MSGTTPQGNRLDVVADTARNIGLVKEEEWPAIGNFSWNEYYAAIPQDVINKAIKPGIAYESIPFDKGSLQYHLKHAPIKITIPAPHPNHAVVLVAIEGDTAYYFDSYIPHLKKINVAQISYALKIVLTIKTMNPNIVIYKNGTEYQVGIRMTSQEGLAQKLVETGCYDLIGPDGRPDFPKIDKIAHVL
jgi:hypothetical protein